MKGTDSQRSPFAVVLGRIAKVLGNSPPIAPIYPVRAGLADKLHPTRLMSTVLIQHRRGSSHLPRPILF